MILFFMSKGTAVAGSLPRLPCTKPFFPCSLYLMISLLIVLTVQSSLVAALCKSQYKNVGLGQYKNVGF